MAKIIILSCESGDQRSTAQAVAEALPEYSVQIIDFLGESLAPVDPFFWMSRGRYTGQDCYNFLLKRNYKRLVNILYYSSHFLIWLQQHFIQTTYQTLLDIHKPALCISVIPLVNGNLSIIAKKNKIPLLIIPTNFDSTSFLKGLKKQTSTYTWLAGGLFDKKIKSIASRAMINPNQVCNIGFPIRAEFFASHCKQSLLKKLSIAKDKKIILLIMGATGSPALFDYSKALSNLALNNIHILVCLAKSRYLAASIKTIRFPSGIRCSILPSSISIAQAMSIADLCITKPESVTFAEAMYSNCVVFLDAIGPLIVWEKFNTHILKRYGNGTVIDTKNVICPLVERFFNDEQWQSKMINQAHTIEKKNFGVHLSGLVLTILSMSSQQCARSIAPYSQRST